MVRKTEAGEMWFAGMLARDVISYADLRQTPQVLEDGGFWCVLAEFDGPIHAWRMKHHQKRDISHYLEEYRQIIDSAEEPNLGEWISDQSAQQYQNNVRAIHQAIAQGQIRQANLCRIVHHPISEKDLPPAHKVLEQVAQHNPAPYQGLVSIPATDAYPGAWVVSASPELGFAVDGSRITSAPMKGTAPTEAELLAKDRQENLMIAEVVGDQLGQICRPETVQFEQPLEVQHHPGLVQLVTTVAGELDWDRITWGDVLETMHPPASVSGTPQTSAMEVITQLEASPRGLYCGQIGWIDADRRRAQLSVAIRTFFYADGALRYGTGAGITAESDPIGEWQETILKSSRLIDLISGRLNT